jgi:hypothetical protein
MQRANTSLTREEYAARACANQQGKVHQLLHDVGLVASHPDHPNIAVESALFELCCVLLQRLADIRSYTRTDYI